MPDPADVGLVGLAVMGQNLALNMADHGHRVAVFNRTTSRVDEFVAGAGRHDNILGTHSLAALADELARPRRIVLMVKAGAPVDQTIDGLLPFLEPGDVVIDGGNSHYPDSIRRTRELADRGILFLGTGISGGEEGARHGPSIMPGGNPDAWPLTRDLLRSIAATADGEPCCNWVGTTRLVSWPSWPSTATNRAAMCWRRLPSVRATLKRPRGLLPRLSSAGAHGSGL